jgi:PqqA peptide cyclase
LHCYVPWDLSAEDNCCEAEITLQQIEDLINSLRGELPLESLALSGGEPLLRKDLPKIVAMLQSHAVQTLIITNGTLLTQETVSSISPWATFEVSLLSHRPMIHDHLVGRRGAWKQTVEGMTVLRNLGRDQVAAFVATKLNYMDLEHTAELALAIGADALMYNRLNLGARNFRYVQELLPTPSMIRQNLETLEHLGETYGIPISVSVVLEPCVIDMSQFKHARFQACPLCGEESYFTIDPSGNLRICNHSPFILGNLLNESFASIFRDHPYLGRFRNNLPKDCMDCIPSWREMCRGGCRAAAEQCFGTMDKVDPFVTLSKS